MTIAPGANGGSRRVFVQMPNTAAAVAGRKWRIITAENGIQGQHPTHLGGGLGTVSPTNFALELDAAKLDYRLRKL